MVTFDKVLHEVAELEKPDHVVYSMPVCVGLVESDVHAARLLLWLQDEMGEQATIGDCAEVLVNALWWMVTAASMHKQVHSEE